jgi:hypothetical protein
VLVVADPVHPHDRELQVHHLPVCIRGHAAARSSRLAAHSS